jgi:hypothetical protein
MALTKVSYSMIDGAPFNLSDFGNDFTAAVAAIGSTPATLVVSKNVTVSASVTLPVTLGVEVINGAVITINSGTLLTINGAFQAPVTKVFTYVSGSSSVVFGRGTKMVIPQWWGATGNGSTVAGDILNETDAMIACFASLRASFTTSNWVNNADLGPATVYIPRGTYAINRSLPVFLNVHVQGEGGNNSPLSFLVQQDLTKPIFMFVPQAYNPDWTVKYETISTGTVYSIGLGSYQSAPFSNSNEPAVFFNSCRQATAYCNANFGASGGSTVQTFGYSDLHFKYVRFVNVAGSCMKANDCLLNMPVHDCLFDNSQRGIELIGSAEASIVIQHSSMYTLPAGGIYARTTSGAGVSVEAFDATFQGCAFSPNQDGMISVINPSLVDRLVTLDSCVFRGLNFGPDRYRDGIFVSNTGSVRIQNNIFKNIDADGASNCLTLSGNTIVKIEGNVFQSDELSSYTSSNFVYLLNSTAGWNVQINNNQFYNVNATAFTNIVEAGSDYSNSNIAFINNIVSGAVTQPLANNVNLIQKFGNSGTGFPTVTYGSGAPGAYTWKVGDIVYNTAPTSGGNIGFVCTTAGTPGTWKTFGTIA